MPHLGMKYMYPTLITANMIFLQQPKYCNSIQYTSVFKVYFVSYVQTFHVAEDYSIPASNKDNPHLEFCML